MSHQAEELDVARQEVRAGKGEHGASCTKSLFPVGSFCWQGSERAQAGGAELPTLLGDAVGAGSTSSWELKTAIANCTLGAQGGESSPLAS